LQVVGIVIHHSVCSAINGKGYDFYITRSGSILPAPYPTDTSYIHICLEGDFSDPHYAGKPEAREQLFLLLKLVVRLSERLQFKPEDLFPHDKECPGRAFPWSQLVISDKDGYH